MLYEQIVSCRPAPGASAAFSWARELASSAEHQLQSFTDIIEALDRNSSNKILVNTKKEGLQAPLVLILYIYIYI